MEALLREIEQFNSHEEIINLEVEYCDSHKQTLCLHLYGELDNKTSLPFEKVAKKVFIKEYIPPILILECSGLSYVSSTGIGSFVSILMHCNRQGIELYLLGMQDKTQNLFSLLGFSKYFSFIESVSDIFSQPG